VSNGAGRIFIDLEDKSAMDVVGGSDGPRLPSPRTQIAAWLFAIKH
jgi:hypothetical protein